MTSARSSLSRSTTSPAASARAVAEVIAEYGKPVRFTRHGVPDVHVILGPPAALYAHYELDAAGVAARARDLLQHTRGSER